MVFSKCVGLISRKKKKKKKKKINYKDYILLLASRSLNIFIFRIEILDFGMHYFYKFRVLLYFCINR